MFFICIFGCTCRISCMEILPRGPGGALLAPCFSWLRVWVEACGLLSGDEPPYWQRLALGSSPSFPPGVQELSGTLLVCSPCKQASNQRKTVTNVHNHEPVGTEPPSPAGCCRGPGRRRCLYCHLHPLPLTVVNSAINHDKNRQKSGLKSPL